MISIDHCLIWAQVMFECECKLVRCAVFNAQNKHTHYSINYCSIKLTINSTYSYEERSDCKILTEWS